MIIIDRYILRQFVAILFFSILSLCVIYVIANLMESLDTFLDAKTPAIAIVLYYVNLFPEMIKMLAPIGMLLTSLFTIGRLSNLNETTAMKSGGMSLYRMMFPLLVFSAIMSAAQLYFNGWIVPKANKSKSQLERKYLNHEMANSPLYNLYFRDTPMRNVVIQYYDGERKMGSGLAIEEYSSEVYPRLVHRIDAGEISWDSVSKGWRIAQGVERTYDSTIHVKTLQNKIYPLNISHEQILTLQRKPEELNFYELKDYIEVLRQGGKDVRNQLIDYYGQYAFPFANFIVVLFAVPFASVKKKSGIAVEIATAMVVSFIYLAFTKISQTIGYSMELNPVLVGWSANILFLIAGIVNLIRTKT